MKKLGIIMADPDDWTAIAIKQESLKRGYETFCPDIKKVATALRNNIEHRSGNINLSNMDAIITRDLGSGKNDAHMFRFDVLRELEDSGTLMINSPEAIHNAANKFYSSCLLSKARLRTPETFVVQEVEEAMNIIDAIEDVVIKPVFGYKGIGIMRIKEKKVICPDGSLKQTTVTNFMNSLLKKNGSIYIQEFINNAGQDIRAFVVDGSVIGAIYRRAADGWWLSNLSQGAVPLECTLTKEQENLCIGAADAIGTLYAGVDLIEGDQGSFVLEVNATPSGAGIYKSLNINVAEHIMDTVQKRLGI